MLEEYFAYFLSKDWEDENTPSIIIEVTALPELKNDEFLGQDV